MGRTGGGQDLSSAFNWPCDRGEVMYPPSPQFPPLSKIRTGPPLRSPSVSTPCQGVDVFTSQNNSSQLKENKQRKPCVFLCFSCKPGWISHSGNMLYGLLILEGKPSLGGNFYVHINQGFIMPLHTSVLPFEFNSLVRWVFLTLI